MGAAKIRRTLDEEHIPTPTWLNYQRYGTFTHIFEGQPESKRHQWTTANIKTILSNEVYIDNSVHNKQTTISFKNKKKVRKPKDEWLTVEGTHEPIISMELWEQAHAHIDSRIRPVKSGETQIFAELLKCADCGWGLRYTHAKASASQREKQYYMCTTYSEFGKGKCSNHYIRYEVIYAVVLGRLQYWISQAHEKDDCELLQRLLKSGDKQRVKENASVKKELARTERRLQELDNLFAKMYEDRAKEAITERNFEMLCEVPRGADAD